MPRKRNAEKLADRIMSGVVADVPKVVDATPVVVDPVYIDEEPAIVEVDGTGEPTAVSGPISFDEWCATPEGLDCTHPRLPDSTAIRATVLLDRLRLAFHAGRGS